MDFAGLSSPAAPHSSLPPSSAPEPTQSPANGRRATPNRPRAAADALTFGDDDEGGADEDDNDASRKRKKPRGQFNADVPLVRDVVGESVADSLETFLKTYVCSLVA